MALISCPECSKQISDKAERCIRCGTPIRQQSISDRNINTSNPIVAEELQISSSQWFVIGAVVFSVIVLSIIYYNLDSITSTNRQDNSSDRQTEYAARNGQRTEEENTQKPQVENLPSKSELDKQPSLDDQRVLKIVSRTYQWYEDGSTATISFQHQDNPSEGTLVLTGSIHTLEYTYAGDRNAIDAVANPDRKCSFVYNYEIRGTNIHATFVKSDCGYDGKDNTLFYNESGNYITAYTSQGEMNFKP